MVLEMNTKYLLIAGAIILLLLVGAVFILNSDNKTSSVNTSAEENQAQTEVSRVPSVSPTQTALEETKVTLTSDGFSPKSITIKKGSKVVWTNSSGKVATVDSAPHPVHTSYPPLNLGSFNDGDSLELSFPDPGSYKYHDHLNASHGGTITVE